MRRAPGTEASSGASSGTSSSYPFEHVSKGGKSKPCCTMVRFPSWASSFDQLCQKQDISNYGVSPVVQHCINNMEDLSYFQIRMNLPPWDRTSNCSDTCLILCLPRCALMKEYHRMYGIVICQVFHKLPNRRFYGANHLLKL